MRGIELGKHEKVERVGVTYGVRSFGSWGYTKGSFNSTVMRFCDLGRRHGPKPLLSREIRVIGCAWT